MIVVGIDPHSRAHAAAAIDEQGRLLDGDRDRRRVHANSNGCRRGSAACRQPRLVAIENARGYGLPLVRLLLAQGEELVDVPRR